MQTQTIIEVDTSDRPGALGALARVLATEGINIEGFSVEHHIVRFLTDRTKEAVRHLRAAGFHTEAVDVFEIVLENRPGSLAEVATALAGAGIHIVNTFGIGNGTEGTAYIRVDDLEKTAQVLGPLQGVHIAA